MNNLPQELLRKARLRFASLRYRKGGRKVVHSRINGYDLLVLVNEDVGRSVHFGHRYELGETIYLLKHIKRDAVCIDVGANVGYFTMLMAQAACDGVVHAFEPIALNAALLTASASLNRFENIRINRCAVGDVTGAVAFSQSSDSAYSSMHDTKRKPLEQTISVPIVTLDGYLAREGVQQVDVLKADVEGAEGLVIAGASQLLRDKTRRPKIVLLELYDENCRAFGTSVDIIRNAMRDLGYKPFVVSEAGELSSITDEPRGRYYNVIFRPMQ